MGEFIVDVSRKLVFQDAPQRLRYRPEDPFIRTIEMGIRRREDMADDNFIGYIECRIWNTASQKDNTFWQYAFEYEKDQEEKPFCAVCNFTGKKLSAVSLIKGKKAIPGWAFYISEFAVYEDVLVQYPGIRREQLEPSILSSVADMLQYSFFIKPVYGFICDRDLLPGTLAAAEFNRLGQIGQTTVYMKNFK